MIINIFSNWDINRLSERLLFLELVESGINYNLDDGIYNLGKKNNQDTNEAKSKTNHNSVPKKGSNLNNKLQKKTNNKAPTRDHADSDPLKEANVAETLRVKDNENSDDIIKSVEEPTETIGGHK